MKIALIHYRLIHRGGLERRLINYTHELHRRGHEVHLIVAKRTGEVTLPDGVQVHVLSPGLVPKTYRYLYFDQLLGRFMKNNTFDLSLSLMRTSHQDMVLCPGNHLGFLRAMGKKAWRPTDFAQIRSDRLSFQHSKRILAASEMMKEEVTELFGIDENKVSLLPPPVDLSLFDSDLKKERNALRLKYGLPENKRLFLFISSSHKRKGLPLLLKLFAQAQDTDATLVIAGLPAVKSPLPNVIDLGFQKEMHELYAAADFTIHPARYEPFGQIIPESLACGTPVLISDKCGAKQIVTDREGLVVPLSEEDEWLELVRNTSPAQFRIPHSFGRDQNLSIEKHIDEILALAN